MLLLEAGVSKVTIGISRDSIGCGFSICPLFSGPLENFPRRSKVSVPPGPQPWDSRDCLGTRAPPDHSSPARCPLEPTSRPPARRPPAQLSPRVENPLFLSLNLRVPRFFWNYCKWDPFSGTLAESGVAMLGAWGFLPSRCSLPLDILPALRTTNDGF